MDQTIIPIIAFGFILGMKHALDVDHLAAVATILAGKSGRWRSLLVGAWWGVGHCLALLILGGTIVAFGITFPPRASLALEFGVGAMLLFLGVRLVRRVRRGETLHVHVHTHAGGRAHVHPHLHGGQSGLPGLSGLSGVASPPVGPEMAERPGHHRVKSAGIRSRKVPLLVGMLHGAAGSAGLTLVLLPTMPTRALGILYLAVFGAGSILGMSLATLLVGFPLGMAGAGGRRGRLVSFAAGALGIATGLVLMVETGGELLRL